jgi:hypothetical protein
LSEITQLTVSSNDYNTVSHAGLKSYQSAIEMSKTLKPKHFHGITPGGAASLPAEEEKADNIFQHSRLTSPGLTSPIRNDEATSYLNSNFGPAGVVDSADDSLKNSSKPPVLEKGDFYDHLPNRTAQNLKEQENTTYQLRNPAERDERRDSRLSDVLRWTDIVQGPSAEPPTARVGQAGVPPPENKPPKGILRPPREKFPEEPEPIREGVAPFKMAEKDGIPPPPQTYMQHVQYTTAPQNEYYQPQPQPQQKLQQSSSRPLSQRFDSRYEPFARAPSALDPIARSPSAFEPIARGPAFRARSAYEDTGLYFDDSYISAAEDATIRRERRDNIRVPSYGMIRAQAADYAAMPPPAIGPSILRRSTEYPRAPTEYTLEPEPYRDGRTIYRRLSEVAEQVVHHCAFQVESALSHRT